MKRIFGILVLSIAVMVAYSPSAFAWNSGTGKDCGKGNNYHNHGKANPPCHDGGDGNTSGGHPSPGSSTGVGIGVGVGIGYGQGGSVKTGNIGSYSGVSTGDIGSTSSANNSGNNVGAVSNSGNNSANGGAVHNSGNSRASGGSIKNSGNSSSSIGDVGNNSGNSRSKSSVGNVGNNSGNSKNVNQNTATGGAGGDAVANGGTAQQSQQQSNNSSGNSTSVSSTYNEVRQTPMAYAPDALPTAPCFKSYTAGASSPFFGAAFGGGKIDKGCDSRETAREFALMHNFTAAAKVLCSTDAAKRAHLTLKDCMAMTPEPSIPVYTAPTKVDPSPAKTTHNPTSARLSDVPVTAPVEQSTASAVVPVQVAPSTIPPDETKVISQ